MFAANFYKYRKQLIFQPAMPKQYLMVVDQKPFNILNMIQGSLVSRYCHTISRRGGTEKNTACTLVLLLILRTAPYFFTFYG